MTIASHPTCESKAYSCIYKRNWEGGGICPRSSYIPSLHKFYRYQSTEVLTGMSLFYYFFMLKSTKGNFTWRAFPYLYMNNIAQFFSNMNF